MLEACLTAESAWVEVKDGNPSALALFRRHYSYNTRRDQLRLFPKSSNDKTNEQLFVGPGEKIVLLAPAADAMFVWRKFRSMDGQIGVNCAAFRNEGPVRASDLIKQAMTLAWERWPGERLYTYVNPERIRPTRTPGRCFLKAGWTYLIGVDGKPYRTKANRLLVLEAKARRTPDRAIPQD